MDTFLHAEKIKHFEIQSRRCTHYTAKMCVLFLSWITAKKYNAQEDWQTALHIINTAVIQV